MTTEEREHIRALGRKRAGELLDAGLMTRKAPRLRALGWPEAIRSARETRKAS